MAKRKLKKEEGKKQLNVRTAKVPQKIKTLQKKMETKAGGSVRERTKKFPIREEDFEVKGKGGVKSYYTKIDLERVYRLCLLGVTDQELALTLDVHPEVIDDWKHKYPQFRQCLVRGRADADAKVVSRLYDRAMGYTHKETQLKVVSMGDGMGSTVERHIVQKHYPPSETAAMYILNNRQSKKWSGKQIVEGPDGQPISSPIVNVITSDEKIKKLMADKNEKKNT